MRTVQDGGESGAHDAADATRPGRTGNDDGPPEGPVDPARPGRSRGGATRSRRRSDATSGGYFFLAFEQDVAIFVLRVGAFLPLQETKRELAFALAVHRFVVAAMIPFLPPSILISKLVIG